MVQLSTAAVAQYAYLVNPPTHATMTFFTATFQPWANFFNVTVNYRLGTLVGGVFTPMDTIPIVIIDLPKRFDPTNKDAESILIQNLIGPNVVPTPGNPSVPLPMLGKKLGEWKIVDIDAIFSFIDPRLAGTIV